MNYFYRDGNIEFCLPVQVNTKYRNSIASLELIQSNLFKYIIIVKR